VNRPTVVKLGGSYAFSPLLRPWLAAIAAASGEVVIVPGGGPFADVVRAAQPAMGFDDRAAHAMAIHAMTQFGIALASIGAGFVVAETTAEMARALAARRVPVWLPAAMLRDAAAVPQSWAVTSDSLALWLARALDAPRVLLVKARTAHPRAGVAALVEHGLVDRAFPDFLARYAGAVFAAGPDDLPMAGLNPRRLPGAAVQALA